ncbi:TonB family protein [Longimicrobium sp.]|uniref:TonB family protein n=1 Tax=Longimicrobium sp. TaxID=2029185 RepID=UPI002C0BEF9A|nr:TonB family protein [Longimicrobium sp.]HSU15164.1 TonB family protein [Longimicrobium sp.]
MRELLQRVAQFWADQDVVAGAPASPDDIAAWEARYGVPMPGELREWFTTLNGMEDGNGLDNEMMLSFYPLSLFCRLPEDAPTFADAPDATEYFVFANHLAWSHGYAVRLTGEASHSAPVFVVYAPDLVMEVAPSFRAFLERYLAVDYDALFPAPPAEWKERQDRELARLRAERATARIEEPPRLANADEVTRELSRFAAEHGRANPHLAGSERVVTVRLRVGPDGTPDHVGVDGDAGDAALDAEAVRAAGRMRFEPGKVDGEPLYVWITLPIAFRFAARPRSLWQRVFGR